VRRRHYIVRLRTMLKNEVDAEIATRRIKYDGDLFTEDGKRRLRSLSHRRDQRLPRCPSQQR
jgi:transposase